MGTINLNLFVAFDALLAERNVTRAAQRLGVTQSALSNSLRPRLFRERYVCIARRGHPTIKKRPSLRTWAETPHVIVSQKPGSAGSVDRVLAQKNLRRTIGVRVSHFLLVPEIVARTDFVAALSSRVVEAFARSLPLRTFLSPLPLPESHVGQIWHERLDSDPGHTWFRSLIAEVSRHV